jgi:D-alanine transaminase
MSRIVYLNGDFLPIEEAKLSIMDRGFLFGDGIYEVSAVLQGRLVDNMAHLQRLERSLGEIRIALPMPLTEFVALQTRLIELNGLDQGTLYIEVTRGVAERDFTFPANTSRTIVMFTQEKNILGSPLADTGVKVVSVPDLRWKRRDIKSVALLAQVLAKQVAADQGAFEAFMVEDGLVTEGGSSTAFILQGNRIRTRPLSTAILPGITRKAVMALAEEQSLTIDETAFSLDEALTADEVFITSASSFVLPVVNIDGHAIAGGKPGAVSRRLRQLYIEMALANPG